MYTATDKLPRALGDNRDNTMEEVMGGKVICDGVLCSILHAMSGSASPNREEFITVIERECDEEELAASWKKLFTHFNEAVCDNEKKPIIEITRRSNRKVIRDIVEQLIKIDKADSTKLFFMPWDYELRCFEGDSAVRAKLIREQMTSEIDGKIDALEAKMEEKNKALVELIQVKIGEIMDSKQGSVAPSYAAVASRDGHAGVQDWSQQDGHGQARAVVGGGGSGSQGRGGWSTQGRRNRTSGLRAEDRTDRSRSSSKRRRGEEGDIIEVEDQTNKLEDRSRH